MQYSHFIDLCLLFVFWGGLKFHQRKKNCENKKLTTGNILYCNNTAVPRDPITG